MTNYLVAAIFACFGLAIFSFGMYRSNKARKRVAETKGRTEIEAPEYTWRGHSA